MKVLLAPLYFQNRFCERCRHNFYRDNPGKWLGIWEFERLPPLGSFDPDVGFRPDFPSLLMFDEYVLDCEASDILLKPGNRNWLGLWPELLRALLSEGAITVTDVSAAGSIDPHRRAWMLRRDMQDPSRWWEPMAYFNAVYHKAENLLGENRRTARKASWDFDPKAHYGVSGVDGEVHDLAVVLSEGPLSKHEAHRTLYDQALTEATDHLREVNACVMACQSLGVAPFVWAPYRKYLDRKFDSGDLGANSDSLAQAGRQFFEVAFPGYAPTTVRDFSKLRRDKRILRLRAEIARAAARGDTLDPRYPQRILEEVLRVERKVAHVRRVIGWIATAIGVIPVPGLGPAASVVAEGIGAAIERKSHTKWHWFYLISDGRGAT
ncbi:MAG: hypothetical protein WCO26_05020 [Deltaproteobacteria bacterium]